MEKKLYLFMKIKNSLITKIYQQFSYFFDKARKSFFELFHSFCCSAQFMFMCENVNFPVFS